MVIEFQEFKFLRVDPDLPPEGVLEVYLRCTPRK